MDASYYKKYEPIFGSWKIKRKIGEGNFGSVFEIERTDFGTTYHSALKAITIPKSEAELETLMYDGMSAASAESYLEQFVEKIVGEFVLMSKLKGNSHIVSYEDHQVIKHKDGIGWDILIRMELLTPMMSHLKTTSVTRKDVIKLGIDMCRALELCQKYNIIHRDIKPENIFISDSGDFKLGDFGIAKEVEKTQSGLTKTGTQTYMAPEVYKGQPYGSSVDMYSLGIVLYRLLNHNRAPFMPQYPDPISYSDKERALIMRMGGHSFPTPTGVEHGCRLTEIVLKACSFNPKDRYSSPTQMREDLEAILYTEGEGIIMFPTGDTLDIKSVEYLSNSKAPNKTMALEDEATEVMDDESTELMDEATEVIDYPASRIKKNKKTYVWNKINLLKIIVPIAAVIIAAGIGTYMVARKPISENAMVSEEELTDPIEFKIADDEIGEADYNTIINRLNAMDINYYADNEKHMFALSKNDLGSTNKEILATIHMITGVGKIEINDLLHSSEYGLTSSDLESAVYSYNDKSSENILTLESTEEGQNKLNNLSREIVESKDGELAIFIDGNVRFSGRLEEIITDGKITIKNTDEKTTFMAYSTAAGSVDLPSCYMKLISSFLTYGELSKTYEIYLDEQYELTLEETEEAESEVQEELEATENHIVTQSPETVTQTYETPKTGNVQGKTSTKKQTKTTETKTVQNQNSSQTQQQSSGQQVQQQEAEQQPVAQQPQTQVAQNQTQSQQQTQQNTGTQSSVKSYTDDVPEIFDKSFD